MKNLFIDANIWLSLYDFTKDNFDKFEALKDLLKDEVNLIIPEQVFFEVLRNRDGKIKKSWDQFKKFDFQIPAFCQSYSEYNDFQEKLKILKKDHNNWKRVIEKDIRNHTLKADSLLSEIFKTAQLKTCSSDLIQLAEVRIKTGNPPGKDKSLGDAINWEYLLQFISVNEDLYFISADRDYCSELDDSIFNFFLRKEWKAKKKANIFFFKTLYEFLQDHANTSAIQGEQQSEQDGKKREDQEQRRKAIVELAKSIEDSSVNEKKNNAISLLQNSGSFASTHNAISLLSKYDSWTQDQIDAICDAAQTNDQIWMIIHDEDVTAFYISILNATKEETPSVIGVRKMIGGDFTEQLKDVVF